MGSYDGSLAWKIKTISFEIVARPVTELVLEEAKRLNAPGCTYQPADVSSVCRSSASGKRPVSCVPRVGQRAVVMVDELSNGEDDPQVTSLSCEVYGRLDLKQYSARTTRCSPQYVGTRHPRLVAQLGCTPFVNMV